MSQSCYHEAGHALIAHLLGATVRTITIESDLDDHDGHTEILWNAGHTERELTRCLALTAIAGPIAELLFAGEDAIEDPEVLSSWRSDWAEFERCTGVLATGTELKALQRRLVTEVRHTLEQGDRPEHLARIADMLEAHETLDEALFLEAIA